MSKEKDKIQELETLKKTIKEGGGKAQIEKMHSQGKLTARERIATLIDEGTFQENQMFIEHRCTDFNMSSKVIPSDGIVVGVGSIDGRTAFVMSQDFTANAGTLGEAAASKVVDSMQDALKIGKPFVYINDSGGARVQEGVAALRGYGDIFFNNVMLSGVVPQISIIAGPCAGGAAYSPALTDFIIQVEGTGQMYITGPKIIKEVTGEDVTLDALGGVSNHAYISGNVHFIAKDDVDAMNITKRLLSFLPSNNKEEPPVIESSKQLSFKSNLALNSLVPNDPKTPYDIRSVIKEVVDNADFMEVMEHYAKSLVIGFARINGSTVGILANQPNFKAGVLDIDSSDKGSKFIRFCNSFNIPLITFVDTPGFMPGTVQEYGGIIRHGAKMLYAYSEATVTMLTVIVRKAYGGAYIAMCSKHLGADNVVAWPNAEIAVMGSQGAVPLLYGKAIKEAKDPKAETEKYLEEYSDTFANPYYAAKKGYIHSVITPAETRGHLAAMLNIYSSKKEVRPSKKHGLIPM